MVAIADYVRETANSPGTGTFNLAGTSTGRRTWTGTGGAFATGTQVYYGADDGNQWEEGVGTVTAGSPNTLSRDTVVENSAGTTARINFVGPVQIYCIGAPAKRTPVFTADNTALDMGGRRLSSLPAAVNADDALRLDQSPWVIVGSPASAAGASGVSFSLPAGYKKFRVEWTGLRSQNSSGSLVARVSTNGGGTYDTGSNYTTLYNVNTSNSGNNNVVGVDTQIFLCGTNGGNQKHEGYMEVGDRMGGFSNDMYDFSTLSVTRGIWTYQPSATITNVLILHSAGAFLLGTVRLLGWRG